MITLNDVQNIITDLVINPTVTAIPIREAHGKILAEDVYSDVDMPPFDKSAMDGYACKSADLSTPLKVVDYIPAGQLPSKIIDQGECAKIMTGAKVPEGADCVIMVELTEEISKESIRFNGKPGKPNICFKGEDVKICDKVLSKGQLISPAVIAIAASVGKSILHIYNAPRVAIIATGDELVEPDQKPTGASIRNSNSYNLIAQVNQTGAIANYMGIEKDTKEDLRFAIKNALKENDVLLLTGGVSMGDKDYVPEILAEIGLKIYYDKLAIQPGKPTAFAAGNNKFCFGLSGNPVSSLLQFELTVKGLLYKLMGHSYRLPIVQMASQFGKTRKRTERQLFFPVKIENGLAKAIDFHGSAHIAGLVNADGFAIFEKGKATIEEGELINVLLLP